MSTPWPYRFRARVLRIRDADTLLVAADLGLRVTHELVVRLAHCNAPESKTVEGQAATTWVTKWLAQHQDPDGWITITTRKDPGDRYGRWLADVAATDGSADLGTDLCAAGHASHWEGKGVKPVPSGTATG